MEPESGFIRALNALWDEVEKGAGRARALFSRPETKKVLIGAALALSTLAFLTPLEITGRLRGGGGARVGSTVGAGERIFVSPHERGRSRLRGGPSGSGASLQSAGPNRKESEERTSAQAVAPPSARAIADLSEVVEQSPASAEEQSIAGVAPAQAHAAPGSGQTAATAPTTAPPPAAPATPAVVAAAAVTRAPAARLGAAPRRLEASRGFSSSQPTKIAASSLSRLGDGPGFKVEATQTRSSFESEGAGAGGASIGGGQAEASLGSSPGAARADAAAAGAGAGAAMGGGGTGGMAENGSGPGGLGGVLADKKKCDEAEAKYGPERDSWMRRLKEIGDKRAAMGRTCQKIGCVKAFCEALVCRSVRVCYDYDNPACVREICEPRRLSSMYKTYCHCSDLRCDFAQACLKTNEANCNQFRACPMTAKRECSVADCSQ